MRKKTSIPRSAFSLIELLVVIMIIAILATLGFGSFSSIRLKSKATVAMAQLRQIGPAIELYLGDNNQTYPASWNYEEGKTYAQYLSEYIYDGEDYRGADNIFVSEIARKNIELVYHEGKVVTNPTSYSGNPNMFADTSLDTDGEPKNALISALDIKDPGNKILLIDGCLMPGNHGQSRPSFYSVDNFDIFGPTTDPDKPINPGPDTDEDSSEGHIRYPYSGAATALMADGSARLFKKGQILQRHVYKE